MAEFPIVEARQELGVTPTRAVRANIDVRTGEGEVGAAIGQGLVAGAKELQKRSVREELLRQKNRDNLDSLSERKADIRRKLTKANIDTMKSSTPPENWEEETLKIVNEGNEEISGFDFSSQALIKQQIIMNGDSRVIPKEVFADAARVISTAAVRSAEEMLTDAYRLQLPDLPQRNINFINTLGDNGIAAKDIVLRRDAAEEAGGELRNKDAVKTMREVAAFSPQAVIKQMTDLQEARKQGIEDTSALEDTDVISIIRSAESALKEKTAGRTEQFNLITGQTVTAWTDKIADPTQDLTETEVWNTPIVVSPEFEKDIGELRNIWAAIARGQAERKLKLQEGTDKKAREEAYDPQFAGELKARAKAAESETDIQSVLLDAADALNSDIIDDADMEIITENSRTRFDTALDSTLASIERDFSSIVLADRGPSSLVSWVQSQAILARATDTEIDSEELINRFVFVSKAKRWAIQQADRQIREWAEKPENEKKNLDQIRAQGLATQRAWLNKSDVVLANEYRLWLSNKL